MRIFLSYEITSNTPMYGGGEGFSSETSKSIKSGDSCNTSKWHFPNHIGTHIDFPYHFHQNGQANGDFPPDFWIIQGDKIQVLEIDFPKNDLLIKPEHVSNKNLNFNIEFLMVKTGFGKYRDQEKYWKYNPGLSVEISDWIKKNFKKIRLIGLDSISVSSWQHRDVGRKAHKKLLNPKHPILFIEDMNLSKISSNTCLKTVYIAPLFVNKSDGAPCTILAEVE